MKKSEIYKVAQICVVNSCLEATVKLEVLRELMDKESLEAFCERQREAEKE